MHKQLETISMIMVQHFKDLIAVETNDSVQKKQNKYINSMKQMLILSNWVQSGNPSHINYVFNKQGQNTSNSIYKGICNSIEN